MKSLKTVLMALAILATWTAKMQAAEKSDTLVMEEVNKVRIETRDTVQRIVISGSKTDPQMQYVQRIAIPDTSAVRRTMTNVKDFNKIVVSKKKGKDSKWETTAHINLGLSTLTSVPDGYSFKLWPSLEFGIGFTADYHPFGRKNTWSIGWAFNGRRYESKDDSYWVKTNDVMALTPYDAAQKETKTSLSVFSLGIPLFYTHTFDNKGDWELSLGAIFNFNTGAHANRHYELDEEEYSVKTKAIGQRVFTVDFMAIIGNPLIPVYVKYCPMDFFKDGRGPKGKQLSFGICF